MERASPPLRVEHVAMVGGGFSGSLQAINLLRHEGPRAKLIERREQAGRGVAYSAAHPGHLLNVRATNMSAFPDDPGHFTRWLSEHRPNEPAGFVSRLIYGDYLRDLLDAARQASDGRLAVKFGEAVDAGTGGRNGWVRLADGTTIAADAIVLAIGNLPPHEPAGLAGADLGADVYAADPSAADIADGLRDDDLVLAIGSGLTMIDIALLLEAKGFGGRILAISRRGLLPHAHASGGAALPVALAERPMLDPAALLAFVRSLADRADWHAVVDALRPFTQDMWDAASEVQRRRFLRHLRPWWDIHRHRLAPSVAARVAAMRKRGTLEVAAGKLERCSRVGRAVRVTWRPRGVASAQTLIARRIVNCSGPQGDLQRAGEPLTQRLVAHGLIRPDRLRLGIDVNRQSETAADGTPNPTLLALGPMTRGAFWEIVAVPDIRTQTWTVARRLSNAHWVEGECLTKRRLQVRGQRQMGIRRMF